MVQEALDYVGNLSGAFRLSSERCFLAAVKDEKEIDHGGERKGEQKFGYRALFADGSVTGNRGSAPDADEKRDGSKHVRVLWEPEACARPENEEPDSSHSKKHEMDKLETFEELLQHDRSVL
jgi:hypothetical protein